MDVEDGEMVEVSDGMSVVLGTAVLVGSAVTVAASPESASTVSAPAVLMFERARSKMLR